MSYPSSLTGGDSFDRREVMTFREILDAVAVIEDFIRRARTLPMGNGEKRRVLQTALKIYGRGYVLDKVVKTNPHPSDPLPGLSVRLDPAEANERFDRVSVQARKLTLLSSSEILRIREACYFDVMLADPQDQRMLRILTKAADMSERQTAAAARGLAPLDAAIAALAEVLVDASTVLRRLANRAIFPEESEIARVAQGLGKVLLDGLGLGGVKRLEHGKLCEASAKAYAILCRAEYFARRTIKDEDFSSEWQTLFAARRRLRAGLLAVSPPPAIIGPLLIEDIRLQLELRGTHGLLRQSARRELAFESAADTMVHLTPQDVVETYRYVCEDATLLKSGARRTVLKHLRAAIDGARIDTNAILPHLARLEEEPPPSALRQGVAYLDFPSGTGRRP